MKTLTALFAAAALTVTAGLAQADVRPDLIPGLLKAGTIMDLEKLNQAALAQHPGTTAANITDTELEQKANAYVYQVEIRDAKGVKWDVDLDAKTGQVLSNKQDK
ncbi:MULTISPECIES: PepSY domain-containing protein [unclassified Pseudomonas]|uniref:PepSY domain-containing protein n=1 Tax=unclassified Pseudomonas TaxID=196821 RepID=UPI001911D8C9|nr:MULTISPECIES: PepSY domain-containing protein [unclassified Pseudomonas]MBK5553981.1 PepSY domain-containing protein [Pseudomonas sp. TH03]MEB0224954.1 PepSY domain-containing protein [Pseudomonas sp. 5S1]MEB0295267.1 PepSY domain-containing protein [Pseudomonas sp. 10S4]WPX18677.1 PepSY domain-containing protein [Pseudomonas sp. 10S4]